MAPKGLKNDLNLFIEIKRPLDFPIVAEVKYRYPQLTGYSFVRWIYGVKSLVDRQFRRIKVTISAFLTQ